VFLSTFQYDISCIENHPCRISLSRPSSMQREEREKTLHITILAGEYYASNQPVTIHTLLGSCVSACLYDPVNRVIGMNHFLLSNRRYAKNLPATQSEAGKYGIQAMDLLINEMLKLGARRKNLRAKVFGGASIYLNAEVRDNFFCVGEVNIRFIREFLKEAGIPLDAEDLGGERARVIQFLSDDYAVRVKKIEKTAAPNLVQIERQYWLKTIESREKMKTRLE
jgi:chemotaxis protein CheD